MKIFKWIFGLFAAIGGILAMMLIPAGGKSKKKALKEIKEKKYEKKNVSTKKASDFLKNFSKEKK